jgi:hypothetical protein
MLAVLLVLQGMSSREAIRRVRCSYCDEAIESREQMAMIRRLAASDLSLRFIPEPLTRRGPLTSRMLSQGVPHTGGHLVTVTGAPMLLARLTFHQSVGKFLSVQAGGRWCSPLS